MIRSTLKKTQISQGLKLINNTAIINSNLLLESKDMRNAAIYGILKPSLSFIRDCDRSFTAFTDREVSEQLRDIACTENLVDGCKMGCALFMAEIRCKYTASYTLSSQEFASTTRGTRTSHLEFLIDLFFFFLRVFLVVLFFCSFFGSQREKERCLSKALSEKGIINSRGRGRWII